LYINLAMGLNIAGTRLKKASIDLFILAYDAWTSSFMRSPY